MTSVATPENEARLVELAKYSTAHQLRQLCRKYQTVVDPSSPARAERFFRNGALESGMVRLSFQVLPEEAAGRHEGARGGDPARPREGREGRWRDNGFSRRRPRL